MSSSSGSIDPAQFYALKTPKELPPIPMASPLAFKSSGHSGFSSVLDEINLAHRQMADEMKGRFLGPMPVKTFLNDFLPFSSKSDDSFSPPQDIFDKVVSQGGERDMYLPLIQALVKCVPELTFVDSSTREDPDCTFNGHKYKPDVSVYSNDNGRTRPTDFSRMEIAIEIKDKLSFDAFQDPKEGDSPNEKWEFAADSEDARNTRGQITSYAVAHMGSQFRSFIFSVLICRNRARLIRWDRAGAIVSRSFDYTQTRYLSEFFWRYQRLTPYQRGVDDTVTRLDLNDPRCHDSRVILNLPQSDEKPLFNFEFSNGTSYIGYSTEFSATSLPGRATRCFIVHDQNNIVFLKDTWRVDRPSLMKEGDVYKELHRNNVPHISKVELDQDIGDQKSVTQKYQARSWVYGSVKFEMTRHQHYRIVLGTIGQSLTDFSSSYEFVSAIRDAVEAHKYAYEKANILHRDISAGNILITPGGGLLIDWDLSKSTLAPADSSGRERTGTWQFISAALLLNFGQEHCLVDDLESVLHVTSWVGLRYLEHNFNARKLFELFKTVFDAGYVEPNGTSIGAEAKEAAIMSNQIGRKVAFSQHPRFNSLITALTELIAVRYEKKPTAEEYHLKATAENLVSLGSVEMEVFLKNLVAWKYDMRTEQLKNSDRVLEIFDEHLKDRDEWPRCDRAIVNKVEDPSQVSSTKRKSDGDRSSKKIPKLTFPSSSKFKGMSEDEE